MTIPRLQHPYAGLHYYYRIASYNLGALITSLVYLCDVYSSASSSSRHHLLSLREAVLCAEQNKLHITSLPLSLVQILFASIASLNVPLFLSISVTMATADVLSKVDLLGPPPEQVNLEANFDKAEPTSHTFDPVALKQRYIAERDKRLQHGGGINQYNLIDETGQFSHYLKDPWCKPCSREPVSEVDDVVIIGGGYGAQLVAVRLIEAGVKNIRLIEKAGDFGEYRICELAVDLPNIEQAELGTGIDILELNVTSKATCTCRCWRSSDICQPRSTPGLQSYSSTPR